MIDYRLAKSVDKKGIEKITEEFNTHGYSHAPKYFDEAVSNQKMFVALDNEKVIGYITYHIIWGNTPFIELLRVSSAYQRKHVGSQLLSTLEDALRDAGYHMVISSSEKINEVGNNFHKKQGFNCIGELDMAYGKEIYYLKNLT